MKVYQMNAGKGHVSVGGKGTPPCQNGFNIFSISLGSRKIEDKKIETQKTEDKKIEA